MRALPRYSCVIAILIAVATGTTRTSAQVRPRLFGVWPTVDALFDDTVVHDVRLAVNTRDWQTLKDRFMENTYYPADFRWRDHVVRNVGIRSRGTGSRSGTKPGLRVDFERYTDGQRFLGLKSVVLRNNTQDASNMNERLSMLLFQRMGMPAPRETYARLFVNDAYVGLYTLVEEIDKRFLKRVFDEDDGYLFSYDYPTDAKPYYFEYLGADPALYVPLPFKPETNEDDPEPEVIEQLVWTINQTSSAVFRNAISEYLDLPAFVRFVALETFLADTDGVLGDLGMNNYYMYRFEQGKVFTFLPWDKSESFKSGPDLSVLHNIAGVPGSQTNRLMARALSYPDLYALYLDTLLACARSAEELAPGAVAGAGWLEREIQREYQQIREPAVADPVKPFSNDDFERAVADLIVFARERGAFVRRSVEEIRIRNLRTLGDGSRRVR
jgi:spore coat protein CotH